MKTYETYKDSGIEWIGEIPEHWKVKPVKHNFKFTTGFTPPTGKREFYDNGEYIWINISDLQDKYISDSEKKITDKAIEKYKPEIVKTGSLLYSFKLSVGRVGFVTKDCYTNEAIFSIEPKEDTNLNFFYYSLPEQIIKNANENIYGAKILNQELIRNATLIVPSPEEQTAIADYLDKKTAEIDQLIANKEQLVALYQEEKTALINQAVTKGINPNAKLKDSGIEWLGDIPEHWEVKRLKFLADNLISGPFGSSLKKDTYTEEGYKIYGQEQVIKGDVNYGDYYISETKYLEMSRYKVEKNDILISRVGTFGKILLIPDGFEKGIINPRLINLSPNNKLVKPIFLYEILKSEFTFNQMISMSRGGTMGVINLDLLKQLNITVPPKEEQTEIVQYIENESATIDAKIAKARNYIKLLTEYRTALISEVVTGKIKVTD